MGVGFWALSVPAVLFEYQYVTGTYPDLSDQQALAQLSSGTFAISNNLLFCSEIVADFWVLLNPHALYMRIFTYTEALAFVNRARSAVAPLRIGLALSTTTWIQKNNLNRLFSSNREPNDS